ncbi:MAG: hypothetical protein J6A25_12445 [Lachnospiraceae bacterium]|nr:hypothetical protein [Lachnospiraceae bacterium]
MNNKEFVRGVYDEIHAPEELFGKVMDMNKKEAKKNKVMRFAAGAVATLALAFVASNGICYAATGETWVEKAIVYINGEEQEVEIEMHQDGDTTYGEVSFEVDEEDTVSVIYNDTLPGDEKNAVDEGNADAIINEDVVVIVEDKDGRVYLKIGEEITDITEDFADGEAKGTVSIDGTNYDYTITGNANEYNISISSEQ